MKRKKTRFSKHVQNLFQERFRKNVDNNQSAQLLHLRNTTKNLILR